MLPEFQQRLDEFEEIGDDLCQAMTDYLSEIGMDSQKLPRIKTNGLVYREQRDPFTGEVSLYGEWRDANKILCGNINYRVDGSLYLEHDVLLPHPTDKRWIIEAITAWGTMQDLRLEPRLMPALEE